MTPIQKLEFRRSEVRERLAALAGAEGGLTDEQRTELRTLTTEAADLELKTRALLAAEPDPDPANRPGGEGAEVRSLAERASLGEYLAAAVEGRRVSGVERELTAASLGDAVAARGDVVIPWEALEVRADAPTNTTALDGPVRQRPILPRLFAGPLARALGTRFDSVPSGQQEYVLVSGGVAPAQKAESADVSATAATFGTATLKPRRLTANYLFTVEQAASVGAQIESALRRDLTAAIRSAMENGILNGNGTAPNVTGVLSRLTAPSDPVGMAGYKLYAGAAAEGVDGIHAQRESEVALVVGTDTYKMASKATENGQSGIEALTRRSRMVVASGFMPATASNIQQAVYHAGMHEGDSVAAVWPGLQVVRDPYTAAAAGQVRLTAYMLWDAYAAFRAGAYGILKFKFTA